MWNEAVFGAGDVGNEVLGHAGTEVLGDAGTEVVGEVATELLGTVLDVVFPGLTLLRWGFRLMSASAVQARAAPRRFTYRDALSLSATGALSVVGWLLSAGPEVTLGDPGMAEMVSMMVSGESEVGGGAAPLCGAQGNSVRLGARAARRRVRSINNDHKLHGSG